MGIPSGNLSVSQFEIMSVIWSYGKKGATVTEVWNEISKKRSVIRSTVQNLVERLVVRGWLSRRDLKGGLRFRATVPREDVEKQVMAEVVDGFFGGSATHLVQGLLGSGRVTKDDIGKLRKLLADAEESPTA